MTPYIPPLFPFMQSYRLLLDEDTVLDLNLKDSQSGCKFWIQINKNENFTFVLCETLSNDFLGKTTELCGMFGTLFLAASTYIH